MNYTADDFKRQAEQWEAKARAEHEEVLRLRRLLSDAEAKLSAAPDRGGTYPPKRQYGADEGEPLPEHFLPELLIEEYGRLFPGVDAQPEFTKFRRYYGDGKRRANWEGVWRSWLKRASERLETAPATSAADEWNPPF